MVDLTSMDLAAIITMIAAAFMLMVIVCIALYVYTALVWMSIAKKLKYDKAWLAWIPIANLFLIPILAKKEWTWGFIFLVPIANIVFYIMWTWAIFERRGFSGYLSLIPLLSVIPYIGGLASIAYLVILGIVAWSK